VLQAACGALLAPDRVVVRQRAQTETAGTEQRSSAKRTLTTGARAQGTVLESPDIRAGMAMLIAALGAQGISRIRNVTQIERGYERIDGRLKALGARIERKDVA
jgi:UDP-N-acetylglucosamine enolpyruvyl transferase